MLTDKSISFLVLQRVLQQALKTLKLNAATSDFSVINYEEAKFVITLKDGRKYTVTIARVATKNRRADVGDRAIHASPPSVRNEAEIRSRRWRQAGHRSQRATSSGITIIVVESTCEGHNGCLLFCERPGGFRGRLQG